VPARLRPTAAIAPDAILVGDPGRALLLAQELLAEPKMSNHARGLWGYSGETAGGRPLTIQSTGIGGPSAAVVLGELAELGVRRALRVGTASALDPSLPLAGLVIVDEALAEGGSAAAFGMGVGEPARPDADLTERLAIVLGPRASTGTIASFDADPGGRGGGPAIAWDMQTAALLARSRHLGVRAAALLIVTETAAGNVLEKEGLEATERAAGSIAASIFST
jgi:uridine phosphorylase